MCYNNQLKWELEEEENWTFERRNLVENQIYNDLQNDPDKENYNVELHFQDSFLDENENFNPATIIVDIEGIPSENLYNQLEESMEKLKYPEDSKQDPVPILTGIDY